MCDMYAEDSLTKLNTELNKSMTLMENVVDTPPPNKRRKSVKINTKIEPSSSPSTKKISRKSVLKNSRINNSVVSDDGSSSIVKQGSREIVESVSPEELDSAPRPRNLDDFAEGMTLIKDPKKSTFNIDDMSDNEEFWIVNIPKTIDPNILKGQRLTLGVKSKIKIGEERFSVTSRNINGNLTCVFSSREHERGYKAVNIKPAGALTVQRKLSSITKIKTERMESTEAVPFPQNLKVRHPLFGAVYKDKIENGYSANLRHLKREKNMRINGKSKCEK